MISYVVCSSILTVSYVSVEREFSFRVSINNETLRISFIPNKYNRKKMGNPVVGKIRMELLYTNEYTD